MITTIAPLPSMSSNHVPDGRTQVQLFQVRKNAERNEIERRSRTNETLDAGSRTVAEIQERNRQRTPQEQAREMANAEETIVRLVRHNAAFMRTIEHLSQAWGPKGGDQAQEEADRMVNQIVDEFERDAGYEADCRQWAQARIKNGPPSSRPSIKRKPR